MRIIRIPEGMTLEEFKEQYGKTFKTSSAKRREELITKEYNRLSGGRVTGILPDHDKSTEVELPTELQKALHLRRRKKSGDQSKEDTPE